MRAASDLFTQIGTGSRSVRILADVFYDDEPTFRNLPVQDWDLTWDLESELKSSGTLTVAYTSEAGESLSPRHFLDVLAPYGQQINLLVEVTVGPFTDVLQLGRFRINQSPEATDSYFGFLGQTLTAGSLVKITVDDLLSSVKRDGFHWPEPPNLMDSTWAEIQRLTGLPIAPNLDDLPTPAGLIYQPKEGGRLEAVQQLTSYLGGVGVTNSFGEVTAIPFAFGPPVAMLAMGEEGAVLSRATSLDSEGLYNLVVGTYQEEDGTPIYATAYGSGALAPEGPFGEYTYYDSSDIVKTQAQADKRVTDVLTLVQNSQSYRISLQCVADYRLEQGDVVTFQSLTGAVTGRIITIGFASDGTMTVTLDVRR